MILKSFQILAICTTMAVTPSKFNYEQPKKANENTPYTITIAQTDVANNTRTDTTLQITQYTQKRVARQTYNEFFINAETIAQTCRDTNDEEVFINNEITPYYTPTVLTMIQFTPYKNLVNNQITIAHILNLNPYTAGTTSNVKMYSEMYICQDDRWLTYMDQTTYSSFNNNINIINDITNGNNGFIYTKTTETKNLTLSDSPSTREVRTNWNVPVNPNNRNYIFIINYLQNVPTEGSMATGIVTRLASSNKSALNTTNPLMEITGEYINASVSYEVINVPNIMFEVLTMPFTFISMAFNLTLFPNTPYQINISNLMLSIIGFLVFILIIKKLTGH